ncbi:MAG: radical SAM/SPASM domain-containing protein [Armatimonadota bacterium]
MSVERQEFTLLGVRAGVEDGNQVSVEGHGPLGRHLDPLIKGYYASLSNQKVLARQNGANVYTLYQPPFPSQAAFKLASMRLIESFTGQRFPTTATLAITHRCQCRCEHCSAAEFMRSDRPEVSPERMFRLIDEAQELGVVTMIFVGGEPLLHPNIYDYIKHVDYNESRPSIFTNGLLLTEERVQKLVDAGLYSLFVSIDSPDPQEHNRLRGVRDCWQKAIDGAQRCIEAGLLCGLSTYATRETLANGQVERMVELTQEIGAHEITIFDVVPTGKLLREEEHILLTDEDKAQLRELSRRCKTEPALPGAQVQAHVNSAEGFGCFAGYFQFYMTSSGDITPCDFTPLAFGNIQDEPLQDIWLRMTAHEAYRTRCDHCRMQDREFRARYIDQIPDDGRMPYPIGDIGSCSSYTSQEAAAQAVPSSGG